MDGLSAASSIITLFELAKEILEFRRRLIDAPAELQRLLIKIESLALESRILLDSRDNLSDDDFDTRESRILFERCIESTRTTVQRIQNASAKAVEKPGWKAQVQWATLGRVRMENLMAELQQTESALSLVMQLLQWQQSRLTNEGLQQIGISIAALILEFKSFKRPCDCCKRHFINLDQTETPALSSNLEAEKVGTITRTTASHFLNRSPLKCMCGLHGTMVVTDTTHDRRYVSSIHLKILSRLVLSLDLMVRLRSWSSLSLDGSKISLRHFVREDSEFMSASGRGDVVTMRRLLNRKEATPFDVTDGNMTPLAFAIQSGTAEAVDLLLTCGADVNDVFGLKQTSPLDWALKLRSLDVARLLVSRGASFHHLSIYGWSPLFYLWSRTIRHPSSIEYLQLLRSKHDFSWLHDSLVDIEGWGLMHRAAIFGTPEDVLMLIRFGVDPCQPFGDYGWMVLHNVVHYGVIDVFLVLLPYYRHLGVELPDHRGWTLLHIAASQGNEEMISELLRRGADADAVTKAAWVDMPKSIQGKCCSVAEVAEAFGEDRYSTFMRVATAVNGREIWHDAEEISNA